uniref:Uncharacterized protein n=1 Tax=Melopsittacus undulatus TaxID=13146 RepID=A0A8V5GNN1_MELUD
MLPSEHKDSSPRFGKLHFPVGLWINWAPKKRTAKRNRRWPSVGSVRSISSDTPSRTSDPDPRPSTKPKASRHKRLSHLFHRSGIRFPPDKKPDEAPDPLGSAPDPLGSAPDPLGSLDPLGSPPQLPSILKIFAGSLCHGANYKSVLATAQSTAQELVREALDDTGATGHTGVHQYVLCDVVGRTGGTGTWYVEHIRALGDAERPLVLQDVWKPKSGCMRRFEIHTREEVERMVEDGGGGGGAPPHLRRLQRSRCRAASGGPPPPQDPPSLRRSISDMNLSTRRRRDRKAVLSVVGGAGGDPPSDLEQLSQGLIQPPQHQPYFLVLQGYGKQDFVLYTMTGSQHIFGRRGVPPTPPHCPPPTPQPPPPPIDTFLDAPDILPRHCLVWAPPGAPPSVRPYRGAPMTLNGTPLFRRAPLMPGDLLGLGEHFLLLYKDPRCGGGGLGQRPPPWLPMGRCEGCSTIGGRRGQHRALLPYRARDEERLLREIIRYSRDVGLAPQNLGVLAPAFLMGLCMEHAWGAFPPQHLPLLMRRIAMAVKEEVWVGDIGYRGWGIGCGVWSVGYGLLVPDLRPLTLWLANATELLNLSQARVQELEQELELEGPCPELSKDLEMCDEALGVLDEVIMSTFQQTVYYLTKRLYTTLPSLLEANPFAAPPSPPPCACAEPARAPDAVGPTLRVFEHALELGRGCRAHLLSQTCGYLLFFCNASLFNTLMERGIGDIWALSPAQLHHILSHYQLGGGQAPPPAWSPPPEERDQVTAGDIFESFSDHPPLLLPTRGFLLRPGGGVGAGLMEALNRMRRLLRDLENEELPANQRGGPPRDLIDP